MKCPIGISDFEMLRQNHYVFIDKSLIIKDIIDDGANVILFTRPRRFGKTLNMSMLYYYFSIHQNDKRSLFSDLVIWQQDQRYQAHQGKYPVIFLSLRDVKATDFSGAFLKISSIIRKLYEAFKPVLLDSLQSSYAKKVYQNILNLEASQLEIEESLKNLTEYLDQHYHQQAILLIDKYDTPIHMAFQEGYYEPMKNLMRQLLGGALKDNTNLKKGILTGILKVSKESIFSDLNNLKVYSSLSTRYTQYFGFLESDVQWLLKKAQADHRLMTQVKAWYNGYQFGNYTLYNPWSILNFIQDEFKFQPYWVNTSDNRLIDKLLLESPGGESGAI